MKVEKRKLACIKSLLITFKSNKSLLFSTDAIAQVIYRKIRPFSDKLIVEPNQQQRIIGIKYSLIGISLTFFLSMYFFNNKNSQKSLKI